MRSKMDAAKCAAPFNLIVSAHENIYMKYALLLLALAPVMLMAQDWSPSNMQKQEVVRLYKDYYSVKDEGAYNQAYEYLAQTTKELIAFERWQEITLKSNAGMGKVEAREIKKITWYNNPEGSASPGIYAAIDFEGHTEKANIYCGYVIWQEVENSKFVLLREEQNYIDKANEALLREQGKFEEFKAQIGC